MIYSLLAPIYDKINADIDYSGWADFIEEIVKRELKDRPELVLDLGCGTGRMTLELARRGYDMTGVDLSPEMLDVARMRADDEGLSSRMLWLCQDMRSFELYGTVGMIVSCLDSVNHLIDDGDLEECFSLVRNYLDPDGIFIFDINGMAKFREVYADNTYAMEEDGAVCIWQNSYDDICGLCDFYITLFKEEEDGRYSRYEEVETERAYTIDEVCTALRQSGLMPLGVYSDFNFNAATDDDERVYFVARCIK